MQETIPQERIPKAAVELSPEQLQFVLMAIETTQVSGSKNAALMIQCSNLLQQAMREKAETNGASENG